MREHLTELLPLVLVGVVLLVFQLTRDGGERVLRFLPLQEQAMAVASPVPKPDPPAVAQPKPTPSATPMPAAGACNPAGPTYVGGMAALKASLGASMGEPLACERAIDDQGDTQQNTTTGLAYYRKHLNVPCFTTGWDHWAVTAGSLVHWTGDSVDPPADASPITR